MATHRLPVHARAALTVAVAAREVSDYARGLAKAARGRHAPGERIRQARRLRALTLTVLDRAVLTEALTGTSWTVIADALGADEEETVRRYAPVVDLWRAQGTPVDDEEDAAELVDAWVARHDEPWETRAFYT